MTKSTYTEMLQQAFTQGTPFINYTEFYSYALIPQGGGKWLEVSYDFEDHEFLENHIISGVEAFQNFCEEIEKAMSSELEVFYLNRWTEFKEGLSGSEEEKLIALISELVSNPETYAENLPVVLNQESTQIVIDKL